MSFILDALKKSESERQRKAGPALYEVKLAPPRNRLPWWMITVGALLGVNLIVVIWLLMRAPAAKEIPPAAAATATPTLPATLPAATASLQQPAVAVAPVPARQPTLTASAPQAPAAEAPLTTGLPPAAAADDLAPAVEAPVNSSSSIERVRTSTEAGLPSYQEVAAKNTRIPQLHLDFHLYTAKPQDRFVFINMKKMHEGDAMPEGVRVDSINDEGAVLSFEGTRFTLLHE